MPTPVHVRVRPLPTSDMEWTADSITVGSASFNYPTSVVGPDASQEATAQAVGLDSMVQRFVAGYDVNLMALGQTGSGKTYSIFGPPGIMGRAAAGEYGTEVVPEYGLLPRVVFQCLNLLDPNHQVLTASATELQYGVMNLDLLHGKRQCFLDRQYKPWDLVGQTQLSINSREDILKFFAGLAQRNTAATNLNDTSSRTHCFASLWIKTFHPENGTLTSSRLQFVDLAGSERLEDAHELKAGEKWSAETWNGMGTNFSLAMLSSSVREAVRLGDASKMSAGRTCEDLTKLLFPSLLGTAHTALLVCLNPIVQNHSQSRNSLDFGQSFAELPLKPRQNKPVLLKKRVAALKELLAEAESKVKAKVKGRFFDMRVGQVYHAKSCLAALEKFH